MAAPDAGWSPGRRLAALPGRHLSAAHRPTHRGPERPRRSPAVAVPLPVHQPDLPAARARVLRPPVPVRARPRRPAGPRGRPAALGSAARQDLLTLALSV